MPFLPLPFLPLALFTVAVITVALLTVALFSVNRFHSSGVFEHSGSLFFLAKTVAEPFGSDQTLI